MQFSDEQIKTIENYAGLFLTYKEIAILLKIDFKDFINEINKKSEVFNAYVYGKTLSEMKIKEQIVKFAELGSPVAQVEALKLIQKQKTAEKL
jgi:hypothetical protein